MKYKMLQPENVFEISNFINNIKDNTNAYISPYIGEDELTEQYIRINTFEYKEFYFGMYNNETIVNLIGLIIFPNPPFKYSYTEIKVIGNVDLFEKGFFDFCKNTIKDYFDNISKITCYLCTDNTNMKNVLKNFNFEEEVLLKKEIKENKDIIVYSNFSYK